MTPEKDNNNHNMAQVNAPVSLRRKRWSALSPGLGLILLVCFLWYLSSTTATSRHGISHRAPVEDVNHKVPMEVHIMSKCPDARDCLRDLVLPTMERVGDKVSFRLSFIGTASDKDDSVECKHGPTECLGDMIELCAADLYPDPKIYLGFANCLSREYARIPERDFIEDCAAEHGVDFRRLNDCVSRDDGYGVALLRESVERTKAAGVTRSCTIRLDEKIRCVLDGGEWKDCEGGYRVDELVHDVETLYHSF